MPVTERPYTFRAPEDLGARIRRVSVFLDEVEEAGRLGIAERMARELSLALVRDTRRFSGSPGNQSAFMRETVELIVSAAEKIVADLEYADAYRQVAAERTGEEKEFRRAAKTRTAQRWHDV